MHAARRTPHAARRTRTRTLRYGKHHHEMRWWHQAHFALWGRPSLLANSDGWFVHTLANASSFAAFQGYGGARWPKMVAPVISPDSPLAGTCYTSHTPCHMPHSTLDIPHEPCDMPLPHPTFHMNRARARPQARRSAAAAATGVRHAG